MKSFLFISSLAAALLALCILSLRAQPNVPVSTKEFMREKLGHSQKLLAALATEDFTTLEKDARKLSAMTQQADWQAFQNPDYTQFSIAFRRNTEALAKASKEKNIDAATLAYVRVTMSCVECHKAVRGKLLGSVKTTPGLLAMSK